MPAGAPSSWLSALIVVGAPLAILASIAYAEVRGRWPRRIVASLAAIGAAATIVGMLVLVV
ncbi:hypothetical protein BRD56_08950 [Thermoplasmatales archaeon SW_10_69_26]|nr:MAG: hypothetical protein BRD56_08950 [Thermoplasmatales archaeon SW_10_69_26]